jgi:hypothetical protein
MQIHQSPKPIAIAFSLSSTRHTAGVPDNAPGERFQQHTTVINPAGGRGSCLRCSNTRLQHTASWLAQLRPLQSPRYSDTPQFTTAVQPKTSAPSKDGATSTAMPDAHSASTQHTLLCGKKWVSQCLHWFECHALLQYAKDTIGTNIKEAP